MASVGLGASLKIGEHLLSCLDVAILKDGWPAPKPIPVRQHLRLHDVANEQLPAGNSRAIAGMV